MDAGTVIGVSITVILASSIIMERFRLPMVLGVLIAGAMFGPASPIREIHFGGFDMGAFVINDASTVGLFGLIGSALILFGIGLEYSIVKMREFGVGIFLAALIKVGLMYILGYTTIIWLGFSQPAAVLLGIILSFSSTPIIIKILEGHGKLRRPEVPFIIAVLIIEDLIAVFLLGIMAGSGISGQNDLVLAIFKSILTFVIAYLILSRIINKVLSLVQNSDETLVLFVVSLVLVIGYFTQAIGLGFSVGAFLAGSIVASSEASRRIEDIVRPFNTVFASFFFFSIGMMVDFGNTITNFTPLLALLFVAVVGKFVASTAASYLSGFTGRSASFAGAALLPLGELSLIIGAGAVSAGIIPASLVGTLAFIIILTSLLSVIMIGSEGAVYELTEGAMPNLLTRQLRFARSTSIGMQRVVQENSRYSKVIDKLPTIGGSGWGASSHEQLSQSLGNTVIFFGASVVLFLMKQLAGHSQLAGTLDQIYAFIVLGFFAVAALFLTNSANAFGIYTQMMRRSGKTGLMLTMDVVALAYFIMVSAVIIFIAVATGDSTYLFLLLPSFALPLIFALDIFKTGQIWMIRWR